MSAVYASSNKDLDGKKFLSRKEFQKFLVDEKDNFFIKDPSKQYLSHIYTYIAEMKFTTGKMTKNSENTTVITFRGSYIILNKVN